MIEPACLAAPFGQQQVSKVDGVECPAEKTEPHAGIFPGQRCNLSGLNIRFRLVLGYDDSLAAP